MPLYIYKCNKCKDEYEIKVSLDDFDTPIRCPECGELLKRVIQPVAFIIK